MEMEKVLIATLCVVVGVPGLLAVMSFVVWQNGFKVLGVGYVTRLTVVLVVFLWIFCALSKIKGW